MRFAARWLGRLLAALLGLVLIALFAAWQMLRGSLPQLDGALQVDGIAQAVSLERDAQGLVTVRGRQRGDVAFATGYAHAQDRFFQMDLSRRDASGELAALIGAVALPRDRERRLHRFRARAREVLARSDPETLALLEQYATGVNAALGGMRARPFEYIVLRASPQPWLPEDSLLVAYAMFLDLNDERADYDVGRGFVARVVPAAVFGWLYPDGTRWDAPLTGAARDDVPPPGVDVFSLRGLRAQATRTADAELLPGSNNWAVGGALTRSGRAIVANDMHLGLQVPTVFYRARFVVDGGDAVDVSGVTLPGTPLMIAGSNSRVAWGYTNSNGDWSDAIVVHAGSSRERYLTIDGEREFERHRERIAVRDAAPEELLVRETIWGPVRDDLTYPHGDIAVAWTAHHAEALNLAQIGLETAATLDEALAVANRMGIPPQNFVAGDADGNIGWTIAGRIPLRDGYDGGLPADGRQVRGFTGWLQPDEYPRVVNPPSGRVWTANTRVVDGDALALLGDGGYALGARAGQIRDDLAAIDRFDARDMLAVHLDDRALFLQRWRDLLLAELDDAALAGRPSRKAYRDAVRDWAPRAKIDAVGYRLVRAFRDEVRSRVFNMLMAPVRHAYPHDVPLRASRQFEGPLWSLVSERPAHLLTDDYRDWRELLLAAVDSSHDEFAALPGPLVARTWGERNTAAIRHPLSRALPWAARWLDMPREPLDGDRDMPRVQGPAFGASERFAVAPGDEQNGYLHMPGGQSGHPLSGFYRRGHADWVHGRPTPFLPGEAAHRLHLRP